MFRFSGTASDIVAEPQTSGTNLDAVTLQQSSGNEPEVEAKSSQQSSESYAAAADESEPASQTDGP